MLQVCSGCKYGDMGKVDWVSFLLLFLIHVCLNFRLKFGHIFNNMKILVILQWGRMEKENISV